MKPKNRNRRQAKNRQKKPRKRVKKAEKKPRKRAKMLKSRKFKRKKKMIEILLRKLSKMFMVLHPMVTEKEVWVVERGELVILLSSVRICIPSSLYQW